MTILRILQNLHDLCLDGCILASVFKTSSVSFFYSLSDPFLFFFMITFTIAVAITFMITVAIFNISASASTFKTTHILSLFFYCVTLYYMGQLDKVC